MATVILIMLPTRAGRAALKPGAVWEPAFRSTTPLWQAVSATVAHLRDADVKDMAVAVAGTEVQEAEIAAVEVAEAATFFLLPQADLFKAG
jgi:hypothetical protein